VRPTSAQIRHEVGHPIVDADGHLLEMTAAVYPFLREYLSPPAMDRFVREGTPIGRGMAHRSAEDHRRTRTPQTAWWGNHTRNTLDRATAMLPGLLVERMGELGIDFAVLYTTSAMTVGAIDDPELRRGLCAGWNAFLADFGRPHRDRLALAGIIPMHTPDEATAELRHCHQLGLKAVGFPEGVLRAIPEPGGPDQSQLLWPGQTHWYDTFGLDSECSYDAVWATAQELGYPVAFHGGIGLRPGLWPSISNYSSNHIGHFAQLMIPLCKSLYFGGVTRRFPELPFAFLECGVSWGAQMLADIVEHWRKRNVDALRAFDPANLDRDQLARYVDRYGGRLLELLGDGDALAAVARLGHGPAPEQPDDWLHLALSTTDEAGLLGAFADHFYFGCEADDRGVATAFGPPTPGGVSLRPIFSSDIGHWDVTDIGAVVAESYELVEDGLLTPDQYRAFTFDNVARMYLDVNPGFFDGTPVREWLDRPGTETTRASAGAANS
jgi:predicted TIM-barrel fold metal-dependent hydrolase